MFQVFIGGWQGNDNMWLSRLYEMYPLSTSLVPLYFAQSLMKMNKISKEQYINHEQYDPDSFYERTLYSNVIVHEQNQ